MGLFDEYTETASPEGWGLFADYWDEEEEGLDWMERLRRSIREKLGIPESFDLREVGYNIARDVPGFVAGMPTSMLSATPAGEVIGLLSKAAEPVREKVEELPIFEPLKELEEDIFAPGALFKPEIAPQTKADLLRNILEPVIKGEKTIPETALEIAESTPAIGVIPRTITKPETWLERPLPNIMDILMLAGGVGGLMKGKGKIPPVEEVKIPGFEEIVKGKEGIPEEGVRVPGLEEPAGIPEAPLAEILGEAKKGKEKPYGGGFRVGEKVRFPEDLPIWGVKAGDTGKITKVTMKGTVPHYEIDLGEGYLNLGIRDIYAGFERLEKKGMIEKPAGIIPEGMTLSEAELKTLANEMLNEAKLITKPQVTKQHRKANIRVIYDPATTPDWYTHQTLGKADVLAGLKSIVKEGYGAKNRNAQSLFNTIEDWAEQKTLRVKATEIVGGDLNVGDKVKIQGEWYTAKPDPESGIIELIDDQSVKLDIFDKLPVEEYQKAEGKPPPGIAGKEPLAREPWEMTKWEFLKEHGYKGERYIEGRGMRIQGMGIQKFNNTVTWHKAILKSALKEGKPLSYDQLRDYPDLLKRAVSEGRVELTPEVLAEYPELAKEVIKPEESMKAGIPLFRTKQEQFAQAIQKAALKKGLETEVGSPIITMDLEPRDAQTLLQKPSHKYGAIPTEMGELKPNYGTAAAKAQQLLMFTERDIRISQAKGRAELNEILSRASKETRKKYQTDIVEGLENPIELTENKNIPGEVKDVIRGLKEKSNRERLEIIDIKRNDIRPYFRRLAEKQYREERGLKGKRLDDTQREAINAQAEELVKVEVPDDWGIKDYFRHLHLGEYALLRDGEYIGSAQNWTEAVTKVAENYVENPDLGLNYEVKLRQFVNPDVVRVSRRRQWKIINDLQKELNEESSQRIQDVLRGKIGAREAQRKWAGFMQKREGLPGYSKDVEFVLNYHNSQFNRWKHLYNLKQEIQPLIEKIKKEGRSLVADEMETNLKLLWGQKTKGSQMFDNWLSKITGDRVRPYALERWSYRLRNLTTTLMLKTSLRYNLLNSMQIMQTGMVVPYKNLVWAQKAVRTAEGGALLNKYGVYDIVKGTAGEITRMYTPAKLRGGKISRSLRLAPETANQAEMWLATFKHAKDALKMGEAEAADYAFLRGMVYSQFLPLKVNYPRALRSPLVRLGPGMYRTFNIGALELAYDLARGSLKKGVPLKERMTNIGRLSHFIGANMALGGARVITHPVTKYIGGGFLTYKLYNQVKDEYGEKIANLIHWGLPSLINSDWSLSVQLFDTPMAENVPEAIGETVLGPLGGTVLRVATQTTSEYGSEDSRLLRGLRATAEKFGGTRQLLGLEKVLTTDYNFKSPDGRLRFEGDLKDALVQMYGSRPLASSIQSMKFDALTELWDKRNDAINSATRLYNNGANLSETMGRVENFNAEWPEVAISWGDILRRADGHDEVKNLDAFERSLKQKGKTFYELFGMEKP